VLARTDVELLMVPLLRQLYGASRRSPNHLYMLQIVVLILSQVRGRRLPASPGRCCSRLCWTRARAHPFARPSAAPGWPPALQPPAQASGGAPPPAPLPLQDASFGASIHRVQLAGVPWYHERMLGPITLGSLVYVVLLRWAPQHLPHLPPPLL
jgi:hypothetical protein